MRDEQITMPLPVRAVVLEQAVGALILVYGLDAPHARAVLDAAAHEADTRAVELAARVVAVLPTADAPDSPFALRARLDTVLFGTSPPESFNPPGPRPAPGPATLP